MIIFTNDKDFTGLRDCYIVLEGQVQELTILSITYLMFLTAEIP